MKIVDEIKLDFDDILLVPSRSPTASRKQVELKRSFKFFHSQRIWTGVPVMAANMDTTGTFGMGTKLLEFGMTTCFHKHYTANQIISHFKSYHTSPHLWVSIGMGDGELEKLDNITSQLKWTPNICIDVANGYTDQFVGWCDRIRGAVGDDPIIMAGNVCTPEMVQELILHGGVDIVKIGIGPGSACTTRLKTGVGYPQLSAIIECSHAAHGLKSDDKRMGLICADGGCKIPADICKAFAANADFVMIGGMFAGTDECEGEWEYHPQVPYTIKSEGGLVQSVKKKSLKFYGMSSKAAQEKYGNGLKDYRSSEGRIKSVPYKGLVIDVVQDILGGLRSACAYTGAISLKDLPKCAKAVRVNRIHFDETV
tara:strand:- start:285 stop:1388 length:1104 start_codon:yes stop_codon:yes gene_type:complete